MLRKNQTIKERRAEQKEISRLGILTDVVPGSGPGWYTISTIGTQLKRESVPDRIEGLF